MGTSVSALSPMISSEVSCERAATTSAWPSAIPAQSTLSISLADLTAESPELSLALVDKLHSSSPAAVDAFAGTSSNMDSSAPD